jgi:hypothetical protein
VWLGLLQGLQWLAQVLAVLWCQVQGDAPFEATLGIIGARSRESYSKPSFPLYLSLYLSQSLTPVAGVALLLMVPVYRSLLPQLFSPWSGAAMPAKSSLGPDDVAVPVVMSPGHPKSDPGFSGADSTATPVSVGTRATSGSGGQHSSVSDYHSLD